MSNTSLSDDANLVEHIRHRLDEGVDGLDDATLSRLEQARRQALAAASQGRRPWWRVPGLASRPIGTWLLPAGTSPGPQADHAHSARRSLEGHIEFRSHQAVEGALADEVFN